MKRRTANPLIQQRSYPALSSYLYTYVDIINIISIFMVEVVEDRTFPNGDRYSGNISDDLPHGLGVCHYSNGDIYDGMWCNGLPNGNGVYYYPNGESFSGNWVEGKITGIIRKTFKNGDIYEGEFENDLPNGQGKILYTDGRSYEGGFRDGKWEAPGVYTLANGQKLPVN